MIHIVGIRKNQGSSPQKIFGIQGSSIESLFSNIDAVVEKIPEKERYNCYYTVFDSGDMTYARSFESQDVIPIDIDHVPSEQLDDVTITALEAIRVPMDSVAVVYSGHGVQILVKTPIKITYEKYFEEFRSYYKNMLSHIKSALQAKHLAGDPDPAVWSASRLMRLPNTINRKAEDGLPDVMARLACNNLKEYPFDLTMFKPEVEDIRKINIRTTVEKEGVLSCPFLKWCKENQLDVSEPQWHAMIGVLAWIPTDGSDLCHAYSSIYPKYKADETDNYIERSLKLTGPRTCNSIATCWDKCAECEHWKEGKINTPLSLHSPDYIKTRDTGFHNIILTNKGEKLVPDYEGLTKYMKQLNNYIVNPDTKSVYIWREKRFTSFDRVFEGGMWHELKDLYIEKFAYENFKPFEKDAVRKEFCATVLMNNMVDPEFFLNTAGCINFDNGVLHIAENKLTPPDKDMGFTYKLPFEYDASATCPRFDQFMTEVVSADNAKIILEFFGMAAAGEPNNKFEKALFLSGTGSNGKSVLMFLMQHLFGKENVTSVGMSDLADAERRTLLQHKLINIVTEEKEKSFLNNTDTFKAVISGESMHARVLYKGSVTIKPNCKQVFSFNNLPVTDDTSRGFFRRCMVIEFNRTFTNETIDVNLLDKLKAESSGIWNRLIEAYKRLKANGDKFTASEELDRAAEEFFLESDTVRKFLVDYVERTGDESDAVKTYDLYQLFKNKCECTGKYAISEIKFGRKLREIYGRESIKRLRRGAMNGQYLVGVKMSEDGGLF